MFTEHSFKHGPVCIQKLVQLSHFSRIIFRSFGVRPIVQAFLREVWDRLNLRNTCQSVYGYITRYGHITYTKLCSSPMQCSLFTVYLTLPIIFPESIKRQLTNRSGNRNLWPRLIGLDKTTLAANGKPYFHVRPELESLEVLSDKGLPLPLFLIPIVHRASLERRYSIK